MTQPCSTRHAHLSAHYTPWRRNFFGFDVDVTRGVYVVQKRNIVAVLGASQLVDAIQNAPTLRFHNRRSSRAANVYLLEVGIRRPQFVIKSCESVLGVNFMNLVNLIPKGVADFLRNCLSK